MKIHQSTTFGVQNSLDVLDKVKSVLVLFSTIDSYDFSTYYCQMQPLNGRTFRCAVKFVAWKVFEL